MLLLLLLVVELLMELLLMVLLLQLLLLLLLSEQLGLRLEHRHAAARRAWAEAEHGLHRVKALRGKEAVLLEKVGGAEEKVAA